MQPQEKPSENILLPHDGFRSRKFLTTSVGTLLLEIAATYGWLIGGKMSGAEWINLQHWLWPLALGIFCGTSVWEKFAYAKARDPNKATK
jgi:hypothetical protein